ncbi:hypothetical protein SAMN05421803_1467 [Nocardiopsis flavescens]|uniref:Uncharacterized protein n=1 Tax=Nocardiopsis flavescens TaxID=758803 RepID=A0A1M6WL32_9ACTN|nr:hypothetical protein [Nocardiopsis flavescens]SHK94482.1 hypothetical protein SAMN05421803_1467 [Nocardiopsis flavescens]
MAPKIQLVCCLCGKKAPQTKDVLPLDAEWRRRHPRMTGTIACECAYSGRWYWRCDNNRANGYDPEHIRKVPGGCIDSASHVEGAHPLTAAVLRFPESALRQGAHEYIRHTAQGRWASPELAQRLQKALAEWEGAGAPQARQVTKAHR